MKITEQQKSIIERLSIKDGVLMLRLFKQQDFSVDFVKQIIKMSSENLTWLLRPQTEKGNFLFNYIQRSDVTINNFLRRQQSKMSYDIVRKTEPTAESIAEDKARFKEKFMRYGDHVYTALPPFFVKQIIEIDEVLRLSKCWNHALTVYRGTTPEYVEGGLVSTSSDLKSAVSFYRGAIWEISLPDAFPFIDISRTTAADVFGEDEMLLPPCSYEIGKPQETSIVPYGASGRSKTITTYPVKLIPHNLAIELLKVMENPPKDYPTVYMTDPDFGWERSKAMLKNYINRYVLTGKIKIGDVTIDEVNPMQKPKTIK